MPELLTKAELAERLRVTTRTIDNRIAHDADFPRPVRVSPRVIRFDADEVSAFIRQRRA